MKALCDKDQEVILHDGRKARILASQWKARWLRKGQYQYIILVTSDQKELGDKWAYEDYCWQDQIAGKEV